MLLLRLHRRDPYCCKREHYSHSLKSSDSPKYAAQHKLATGGGQFPGMQASLHRNGRHKVEACGTTWRLVSPSEKTQEKIKSLYCFAHLNLHN